MNASELARDRASSVVHGRGIKTPRILGALVFLLPLFAGLGPYAAIPPGAVGPLYVYRIMGAVLFVLAVITMLRARVQMSVASKIAMLLAAVYLTWPWATTFWTPVPDLGSKEAFSLIFPMTVLLSLVYLCQVYSRLVVALLWGTGLAVLVSFLIVVFDKVSGMHFIELMGDEWIFPEGVSTGFFGNPNNYACFLVSCSALTIALISIVKSTRMQLVLAALLLVTVACEYFTGSRSGLLGTAIVGLIAYLVHGFKSGFKTLPIAIIALSASSAAIGLFAHQRFLNLAGGVLGQLYSDNSATSDSDAFRAKLSETAFQYFIDSGLMGKGADSFISLISADPSFANNPKIEVHNTLLEIASQYGIFMLAPLIGVYVYAVINVFQRTSLDVSTARREMRYFYRILVLLLLVAVLLYSVVVSSTFLDPYWWLLVAMLLICSNRVCELNAVQEESCLS